MTVTAGGITDADANDPPNQMASDYTFSFTTADPPPPVATNVVINEVDSDTPGADTPNSSSSTTAASATRRSTADVVFYNGSNDLSYAAFDLDGLTNANGYFTLGDAATPGSDLVFATTSCRTAPMRWRSMSATVQLPGEHRRHHHQSPGRRRLRHRRCGRCRAAGAAECRTAAGQRERRRQRHEVEPALPQRIGRRPQYVDLPAGHADPGANNCPPPPQPSNSVIVVSQLYGGGGNAGATYQNDYVELYNRGAVTVDLGGWSLQYASATGSGWDFNKQPLGGTIAPGEYYLISLASSGSDGAALPPANINGEINMSGTNGKVALVNSFDGLVGNCPTSDPHVMDLVGYGTPTAAKERRRRRRRAIRPRSSAWAAASTDTDNNGGDFVTGAPTPRRTAPIVELGPLVLSTDPRANGFNAPRDATITVTFTEPVDVVGAWFDITCAISGQHNSATFAGERPGPLHHAERQLPGRRAVHGHDLQGPDSRSGSGRRRARHRHAAGELRLVLHGRDRHGAAISAGASI